MKKASRRTPVEHVEEHAEHNRERPLSAERGEQYRNDAERPVRHDNSERAQQYGSPDDSFIHEMSFAHFHESKFEDINGQVEVQRLERIAFRRIDAGDLSHEPARDAGKHERVPHPGWRGGWYTARKRAAAVPFHRE